MTGQPFDLRHWSRTNWFLLAAPFLLAVSFLFARSTPWDQEAASAEAVILFDWCVSVPVLYLLCYRKQLPRRQLVVRVLALICLGVWIAGHLVPANAQQLLPQLGWARWAGLAVLALIELRLLAAALKIAFSSSAKAADIQKLGAPPLVAKLMLIEARFWRAVWRLIRGR